MATCYPAPAGGASLLLAFQMKARTVVIVGASKLAASRAFAALEADAHVVVLVPGGAALACDELKWRASERQLELLDLGDDSQDFDRTLAALETRLRIALVCITDTLLDARSSPPPRSCDSARQMCDACRRRSLPVNVSDMAALCDFTFLASYRAASFQFGVTTNGKGCRLGTRLRRDIITSLPKDVGVAVDNVSKLRALAKTQAEEPASGSYLDRGAELCDDDGAQAEPVNLPVPQRTAPSESMRAPNSLLQDETTAERALRRMRWVAQVSEFWPISRLAMLSAEEMDRVLTDTPQSEVSPAPSLPSQHGLSLPLPTPGRVYLVGSGPGDPSLLTVATHALLTQHADVVLSDKLVPAAVLALIPPHVAVHIARKFPGNNDDAQGELMATAVALARTGKTVVRLKQGDPTVFGRAGDEVLHLRAAGLAPVIVPGVSAALAGPALAGIPVTQRGVADALIVSTGVGRGGRAVRMPGYARARTAIVLMGVARLPALVDALVATAADARRDGPAYPPYLPVALIERASMPDQRVLFSTLTHVVAGLDALGEQRPPGMLVIGWAVLCLWGAGDVTVLDDLDDESRDSERAARWLEHRPWRVVEGLPDGWPAL